MQIKVPVMLEHKDFGDYAEALKGQKLHIWLNPPRNVLDGKNAATTEYLKALEALEARRKVIKTEIDPENPDYPAQLAQLEKDNTAALVEFNRQLLVHWTVIWSQGPADECWTLDELNQLDKEDPHLLVWMITQTQAAQATHREKAKKA